MPIPQPNDATLIPVFVLTGFLGSGKTTLLRHLLSVEGMRDTVVLINEFGEVALDHLLVREITDEIVLLKSGCLCCSVRDDLTETLIDLHAKRRAGDIPPFQRVVIETTGLADPAPIILTLMSEELVTRHFQLASLVTTVDAVHGDMQLDAHLEALKQSALAECIVITKTDGAPVDKVESLARRLARINPSATVLRSSLDRPPAPDALFKHRSFDTETKSSEARHWLAHEDRSAPHHHSTSEETHHHHAHPAARHDERVNTFCITLAPTVPWAAFEEWLSLLLVSRGKDILRIKGLLAVTGRDAPTVIHGVHHVFYPPAELPGWPSEDRRSRLVFITTGLVAEAVARSLAEFTGCDATVLG